MPVSKRKAQRATVKNSHGTGRRLTIQDRYLILELHKTHPDWPYAKIGEAAGVSTDTARLHCLAADKSAADLMAAFALPALKHWALAMKVAATRGDHRPTKDWLLHAGSLEPLPETQRGTGTSIYVVNNALPGMPSGQSITIDAIDALKPAAQDVLSVTKGNSEPDNH